MASKARQQIITKNILHNISRTKVNQAINFEQLPKQNMRNIFFRNYAKNEVGRLVPDFFLFFKRALYKAKASGQDLSFNIFC